MERGVLVVSVEVGGADPTGAAGAGLLAVLQRHAITGSWGLPSDASAWQAALDAAAVPQEVLTLAELHDLTGGAAGWHAGLPAPLRAPAGWLTDVLALPPPTSRAAPGGRLPVSLVIPAASGAQRLVPDGVRAQRLLWGLDRAVRRREVCHLRLSTLSLAGDPGRLGRVLTPGLRMAARLRELGEVDVLGLRACSERRLLVTESLRDERARLTHTDPADSA
jgi:hypothetical protein